MHGWEGWCWKGLWDGYGLEGGREVYYAEERKGGAAVLVTAYAISGFMEAVCNGLRGDMDVG